MTAISEELSDLLPCPFCGGEGAYQTDTEEPGVFAEEWIGCLECGATTALEVWNLRSGNGGEVRAWWCEHGDGSIEVVMWPDARDKLAAQGYEITPLSTPPVGAETGVPVAEASDKDVVRVGREIARAFHQEHGEWLSQNTRNELARAALSASPAVPNTVGEDIIAQLRKRTITIDDGSDHRGGWHTHEEPDPLCAAAADIIASGLSRAVTPEPLAREDVPLSVKLAAVKAYVAVAGSCRPAAMHFALQAALAHYLVEPAPSDAAFLIERLDDFRRGSLGDDIEDACRDFDGHVSPAIERLRASLVSQEAGE